MRNHIKHRMAFVESHYATKNVINERDDGWYVLTFNVIVKKNNQTLDRSGQRIMPEIL